MKKMHPERNTCPKTGRCSSTTLDNKEKGLQMEDWKGKLGAAKRKLDRERAILIELPSKFAFKDHGVLDFNQVLSWFNWNYSNQQVKIDFRNCRSANYQALSLLVLYAWKLRANGCRVSFELDTGDVGASQMWRLMGAPGLFQVSTQDNQNFRGHQYKPLIAVRNSNDFKLALSSVENFAKDFNIEYMHTLRYVLSELLYNTLEHGVSHFKYDGGSRRMPSLLQFTWYETHDEIHFIVADVGIGINQHLSQTYPGIESDEDAIRLAIRPQVSGTFGTANPYKAKNNAGVGLYISTNIVRRLNADMHIISGDGLLHVSPRDITGKTLESNWPGTFVIVSVRLERQANFALHLMMQEFRDAATKELSKADEIDGNESFYININNVFGPFAEDKESAIRFRDKKLIQSIDDGKKLIIDFDRVEAAPHSFLSALLATPIKRLGMNAYKKIKVINANPEIRETIDYIMDENTED